MRRLFFYYLLLFSPFFSQTATADSPTIQEAILWSTHWIESFHFTTHGAFLFLNDGSIWMINPDERAAVARRRNMLVQEPITLMPDAGTEHFPLRVIVHEKAPEDWTDFTVRYLACPFNSDSVQITEIDQDSGNYMMIAISSEQGVQEIPLLINPPDTLTVKKWKKGQQVIVGGMWFPEYDPNEHKDYHRDYQYVLYNYHSGNYAFFTFFRTEKN